MVYPRSSGMTVRGPWGITNLGGVNFTSGAVAAAAGEASRPARTGSFLSLGGSLG